MAPFDILLRHDGIMRAPPLGGEGQLVHQLFHGREFLGGEVGQLEGRIALVHVLEGPDIEALDDDPVAQVLGFQHLQAAVHEVVVFRPVLSLAFLGAGLHLDVVAHGAEVVVPDILLDLVDQFGGQRLDRGDLRLVGPDFVAAQTHVPLGDFRIIQVIEVSALLLLRDRRAVRMGSIAVEEIILMRDDDLPVLGDLEVHLERVVAATEPFPHRHPGVLRH